MAKFEAIDHTVCLIKKL